MKPIEEYTIKDSVTYKKEKSIKMALLEDLRTVLATELELEIWRRKKRFNHSHEKIAEDLGITEDFARKTVSRLNRKLKKYLIKLKMRGSNFF
ncbi:MULTISPECIES: hypothetical protein [Bacteria]|uniref:hypothetical protein n=1 Tax=Bacteria TaxID=2 RepID=UPI003F39BD69